MTLERFQQAADDEVERQVRRLNRQLTRHYAIARDEIQSELERLYARVLDGVDPQDYYAVAIKYDRLTKLQGKVREAMREAARKAGITIQQASELAMSNSYYYNQYALTAASGSVGVNIGFVALPTQLVELAVTGQARAYREITERIAERFGRDAYQPAYGTLSDILVNRRTTDLRRVNDAVVQSIIQGRSVSQSTRQLTRAVAITRNNAERIIRTETHRTRALGHYAASQHAKAEGAQLRRQIVAVLDERTRPQSAQVDGQFEDENGQFTYPGGVKVTVPGNSGVPGWDINDRERTIDVVEGFDPESRRARDPVTGQNEVIGFARFDAWAESVGLRQNRYGQYVA